MKINNNKHINKTSFQKKSQNQNTKTTSLKNDSFEKSEKNNKGKKKSSLPQKLAIFLAIILAGSNATACNSKQRTEDYTSTFNESTSGMESSFEVSLDDFSSEYFDEYNSSKNITNKLPEDIQEDISKENSTTKRSIYEGNQVSDSLKTAIENASNDANGYIDNPIAQGITGDCWLIAGIENLSYTELGAKYLHNSLNVNENGDIEVHFRGPNLTYTITPKELSEANGKYTLLSSGDDDMLIFELAVDKFRKDLYEDKIKIDKSLPSYFYYTDKVGYNYLTSGEIRQAYWLLAGIEDSIVAHDNKNDIDNLINKFINNKETSLMSVSFEKERTIKDINNNEITLLDSHEYGIKDIKEGNITLINPYQNIKEIIIPINEFYNLPICDLIYCDIE